MRYEWGMPAAVILAGGLGTRLRGTVPDCPKPMAPVGGRPFLEYQLSYWIAQGIDRFVLSVGYRHQAIVRHFGLRYKGVTLDYAAAARGEDPMYRPNRSVNRAPMVGGGRVLGCKGGVD